MTTRLAPAIAALVLLLAACSGSSGGSEGASPDDGGTTTTQPSGGGDAGPGDAAGCSDLEGEPGVIRTFCDGSGTATFTIGDTEGEIGGGECETGGGYFSFNAGAVTSGEYQGTPPDYAGFSLPEADGEFSGDGVAASISFDGEAVAITKVTGTHDADGGTLEGVSITDQTPVSVTFTCS